MAKAKHATKKVAHEDPKVEEVKAPAAKKADKYVVETPFMDQNNSNKKFEAGEDVSHFDKERLANAVASGLVKKK